MSESEMTISAPAKVNLWLRVPRKRHDGFHEIESRMVPLSLCDELIIKENGGSEVSLKCDDESLPTGEENLVVKAVRAMESHCRKKLGFDITLKKQIPHGAGLGGGSSDAAATILAINELRGLNLKPEKLAKIGAMVGSDVPFFIFKKPCDVSGHGEVVKPIKDQKESIQRLPIVLLKPEFEISAAWAYQNLADARKAVMPPVIPQVCPWGTMENDLERPCFQKFPILSQMKDWLLAQPEVHAALLAGSGSTVFAVMRHFDGGEPLVAKAKKYFGENTWTYWGHTL